MSNIKTLLIIFVCLITLIQGETNFESNCGPSSPSKASDCLSQGGDCCFAQGHILLQTKQICIKVVNKEEQENRIEIIKELNQKATGVILDCGVEKEFPNTCSLNKPEPNEASDCTSYNTGDEDVHCCFVKIESSRYNGTSCRQFANLDINTIGEAVVAAKTIDVVLEVDCISNYITTALSSILLTFLTLL